MDGSSFLDKTCSVEEMMNPVGAWDAPEPMTMVAGEGRVSSSGAPPPAGAPPLATAAPSDPLSRLSAAVGKSRAEIQAMSEEDLLMMMAASKIGTALKNEVLVAVSAAANDGVAAGAQAVGLPLANEDIEETRRALAAEWPRHERRQQWLSGLPQKLHLLLLLMGAGCFWLLMLATVEDSVDCVNGDDPSCEDGREADPPVEAADEWVQYASRHATLQLHGPFASGMTPEQTFRNLGMHSTLSLNFRYFAVGSWDAERAVVWVDGERVWRSDEQSQGSCPSGWEAGGDVLMDRVSADPAPATSSPLDYRKVCYVDVSLVVPHYSDTVTLRFGSTLDEDVDNEAFFFGDLSARVCGLLGSHSSQAPRTGPPPPPPNCNFEVGDGAGGYDEYIGEAQTQQACLNMVARFSDDANGATFQAYILHSMMRLSTDQITVETLYFFDCCSRPSLPGAGTTASQLVAHAGRSSI